MPLSLITLLVVAVVCLILGGIAGILLGSTGGDQEEEPGASLDQAPPGGRKGHYTAVYRLWREKTSGAIVVEVDGKSYLAPDPLRPDQIERLRQAARDFFTWMGSSEAEIPIPAKAPLAETPRIEDLAQTPAAPIAKQAEVSPPVKAAPVSPPVQMHNTHPPDLPAKNTPVSVPVVQPPVANRPPSPPGGGPVQPVVVKDTPKTMVEQIDVVLKSMIAGTPYEAMGLSLTEDLRRGVVVWVGTSSYEGIDGVPDPEIQKLIRSAVAEWERRADDSRRRAVG